MRRAPSALVLITALLTACQAAREEPQDTAPALIASNPANGATGPVDQIRLEFSEPMDEASLKLNLCTQPTSGPDPACSELSEVLLTWSEGNTIATWGPSDDFEVGTSYSLHIEALDLDGNALAADIEFTASEPLDETPPIVVTSTHFVNEVEGIFVHTLVFTEPMDHTSVELAYSSEPATTCTWRWIGDVKVGQERARCLTPPLEEFTSYTFTLATSAADLAGNHLIAPFIVPVGVDNLAPRVIVYSPENGARFLGPKTPIVVTYNEPVDLTFSNGVVVKTASGAIDGDTSVSADDTKVTFIPSTSYGDGALVAWSLDSVRGDYLAYASGVSGSFSTRPVATPTNLPD